MKRSFNYCQSSIEGSEMCEQQCDHCKEYYSPLEKRFFTFEKDPDNRWYVVLPEWKGEREELEMVMGADTMLDIIAQGENTVRIAISENAFEEYKYMLSFLEEEAGGGNYLLTSEHHQFDVWLCHVVKFVYGYIPKFLYLA